MSLTQDRTGWQAAPLRAFALVALICLITALPILAIFVLALTHGSSAWPANLPRLVWSTVALCVGAAGIALLVGTLLAWLVTYYQFPGRRSLKWMALLPLALPGYIISFVYVDAFTYAGPVQQAIRTLFGWSKPDDYWFPEIRSLGGAMLVMGFALYPYVYLAGRAAFMRQPVNQLLVARTLGRSPVRSFIEIALPQARAALFIGTLLVVMECINDIGAATFFGIGTVTTAIYGLWLDQGDLPGAARLATALILLMALLVYLETVAKAHTLRDAKSSATSLRTGLKGWRGLSASAAMAIPVFLGFVLPMLLLISHGLRRWREVFTSDTALALWHSVLLAGLACLTTLCVALLLSHLARWQNSQLLKSVMRFASLGYALPGTVLGIGVLVPFGQFDQWLNRTLVGWGASGPGLLLSGTIFALVFAYATRFLIIAVSQVEDGMAKIPTNMDDVASTLGRSRFYIFHSLHLPLLKPAIISALLLICVDAMKELPATLILRPFDFETLSTQVFILASLGQYEQAAIPALLIVLAGLVPVVVLSRNLRSNAKL
jgi:iron(III) transport system permease protein